MVRFLGGILALALLMGTTATQADAASPAGKITSITVVGNGAVGSGCQFKVTVNYGKVHWSGGTVYAELQTTLWNIASYGQSFTKGGSSKLFTFDANVLSGTQYRVYASTSRTVKGVLTELSMHRTNFFTQGASCFTATDGVIAQYPTP